MAGNEIAVAKYLLANKGRVVLDQLGTVTSIMVPDSLAEDVNSLVELEEIGQLSTENSSKKADFYVNGKGVSVKQSGASFLFNRIVRERFLRLFRDLEIPDSDSILNAFDDLVARVHNGSQRDYHWSKVMNQDQFKILLEYLMMHGSPRGGFSHFPADYILTAPRVVSDSRFIEVLDFESYFNKYADKIFFTIRRQWVGQESSNEHKRALGIARRTGNEPWVFETIVGAPRGWRSDWPVDQRRTVYMLFIQVI